MSEVPYCRNPVYAEVIRDAVARRVISELSIIRSAEHLAIVLDTAIFGMKDYGGVSDDDIRCLFNIIICEYGEGFRRMLALLRRSEERIMSDPRFTSLRRFFDVVREFTEGVVLEELALPWRVEGEYFKPRIEGEPKKKKKKRRFWFF